MRLNVGQSLIVPGLGVIVFLLAYFAQNVWSLFHVQDITEAVRNLPWAGVIAAMVLLGLGEGTVVLGLYLPGTAIVILLLIGLQPGWSEAMPLMAALMGGTMTGYAASFLAGRLLHRQLPSLVGRGRFEQVRSLLERYGLAGLAPAAIHPNQLALAFAILGYFRPGRLGLYFALAAVAQGAWWAVLALGADFIAGQRFVTSSNFQLYVAALFFAWFLYELLWRGMPARSGPS